MNKFQRYLRIPIITVFFYFHKGIYSFFKDLKEKNRNAWILPHCLSLHNEVEIVDFDAASLIGGIINPRNKNILPADLTQNMIYKQNEKTIKVNHIIMYVLCLLKILITFKQGSAV